MTVIVSVVAGAAAGYGLFLLVMSLMRRPVPLDTAIAALEQPGISTAANRSGTRTRKRRRGSGVDLDSDTLSKLEIVGKSPEQHITTTVGVVAMGVFLPVALWLTLQLAAGVTFPIGWTVPAGVVGAAAAWLLIRWDLDRTVTKRHTEFRASLTSYLDLVSTMLAGGAGLEEALQRSADIGAGWAFGELRGALRRAANTSRTPWETLAELADTYLSEELRELAAAATHAGDYGARIRSTLITRAETMRARQSTEVETRASKVADRLAFPMMGIAFGVMIFIIYAVATTPFGVTDSTFDQTITETIEQPGPR